MAEPCCEPKLNPDITGIGVRAALYAQIMLGWVMSMYWPDTYVENSRTAYMTATALLIASFIQLQTQDISLLDGIVVSLITSMMITFAIASGSIQAEPQKQRSNQPGGAPPGSTAHDNAAPEKTTNGDPIPNDPAPNPHRSVTRSFIQFCFTIFWAAWSFNLWKDPAHFGLRGLKASCPPNHDVILSIFGREVDATDPRMRNAALSLVSIGFFIALCSMLLTLEEAMVPVLWLIAKIRKPKKKNQANQSDQATNQANQTDQANQANPLQTTQTNHTSRTTRTTQTSRDMISYENPVVMGTHLILQSVAIATLIYLTVSTERTISKNDAKKSTRQWTYGQTIALILLLQQVMTIFSTFVEKREAVEKEENDASRGVHV